MSPMIRVTATGLALALSAVLGCGPHTPAWMPPRVNGQLPIDAALPETRGLVLARVSVVTNDAPGFGAISNPLVLQFQPHNGGEAPVRTVTLTDTNAHVFTAPSQAPSVWRFEESGLLVMSITPGAYGGLAIAYPDGSHQIDTPDSIPAPSGQFTFTAIEVPPATIVYLGDVEIRQQYDFTDLLLDRIDVTYVVHDEYDRTVADFRARYPQFADVAVARRLLQPGA